VNSNAPAGKKNLRLSYYECLSKRKKKISTLDEFPLLIEGEIKLILVVWGISR
jgi:hypothetical protein